MKIFILEDDISCLPVITWIRDNGHDVIHSRSIEEAVTYLEYEDGYKDCDKFIFDASLPAAEVIYMDGSEKDYARTFNGVDLLEDNLEKWDLNDNNKIVILTAYEYNLKGYESYLRIQDKVNIISKNSNNFIGDIQQFLEE